MKIFLLFYHVFLSKVPSIVAAMMPASMFIMHEKAWNCYPFCRTGKYRLFILL